MIQCNKSSYRAQLNDLTAKRFNLKREMRKYKKEEYCMADWDTVDEWEDGDEEWNEYKQRMQELETEIEETESLIEECCEEPTQVEQPPSQVRTPLRTPTPVPVPQQPA